MRLKVAEITSGLHRCARPSCETCRGQGIAQDRARTVMTPIDLGFRQQPAERPAADKRAEMPLLVRPRGDIDAAAQTTRDLQPIDHAQRAIQPAGVGLRLDMAAEQQLRAVAARAANNVADAVDLGLQPGLGHPRGEPVARPHVVR
jgi:hypothetical protein